MIPSTPTDAQNQEEKYSFFSEEFLTAFTKSLKASLIAEKTNLDIVELIQLCCIGDEEAWDQFIDKFHRRIMLYAYRLKSSYCVKGLNELEIVEKVFLKLLADKYSVLKEFRGNTEESFTRYLLIITRNVTINIIQKKM